MELDFLYIIMCGFGLGFLCWILGKTFRYIVFASSNPTNANF